MLAIGVGVSGGVERIGIAQIGFAAISLALAACVYWAYFGTAPGLHRALAHPTESLDVSWAAQLAGGVAGF